MSNFSNNTFHGPCKMRSLLSTLMMLLVSSLLILQGDSLALQLPPSVKESVTSCRGAVQDVLKSRKSRITVDFPPFTEYQIKSKSKAATKSSTPSTPDLYALHSSNQALAQLFVEVRNWKRLNNYCRQQLFHSPF